MIQIDFFAILWYRIFERANTFDYRRLLKIAIFRGFFLDEKAGGVMSIRVIAVDNSEELLEKNYQNLKGDG